MIPTEPRRLRTADAVELEAELRSVPEPWAAAVLCHPHPLYGGTMRSIATAALFDGLPAAGVTSLRFNFRGVEGSEGAHGGGHDERADVVAALGEVGTAAPAAPRVLVGWSFGADVALSVVDPVVAGWVAVAPPLRFAADLDPVSRDPRPKRLVLAEHDEFREPSSVADVVSGWVATELAVVGGASHFFVGRTERLVDSVLEAVRSIAGVPS